MVEFELPDVGEGVAEGELIAWHVAVGDRVSEDQVLAEVETDKALVDVPSPVNGVVQELHAAPGDVVPVGDVLVSIETDAEAAEAEEPAAETDTEAEAAAGTDTGAAESDADAGGADDTTDGEDGRVFAAPSARQLARELGIDIAAVEGTGPGGRVTEEDVRAAAESEDEPTGADSGEDTSAAGEHGDESAAATDASTGDGATPAGPGGGATTESADRERTLATPATRRVAEELDVDIDAVPATERRDGEPYVTEAAVREYAEAQQAAQAADAAAVSEGAEATAEADTAAKGEASTDAAAESGERREPYRGVRKTIGEQMERSKFTAPHVTHHETFVVEGLVEARERLQSRAEERGVALTYMPFVMKAAVAALDEHPILNTVLDEDNEEIVYRDDYHLGVATATEAGLMVPVVEHADRKGLLELAGESRELVASARDRSIDPEDLRGSTFTITNFGAIGGEYATPIINYPETAILGLGELTQRPVVEDGEVVARHTLPLSLSVDHRVIDGADAARFAATLGEYLAEPTLLLLE